MGQLQSCSASPGAAADTSTSVVLLERRGHTPERRAQRDAQAALAGPGDERAGGSEAARLVAGDRAVAAGAARRWMQASKRRAAWLLARALALRVCTLRHPRRQGQLRRWLRVSESVCQCHRSLHWESVSLRPQKHSQGGFGQPEHQ